MVMYEGIRQIDAAFHAGAEQLSFAIGLARDIYLAKVNLCLVGVSMVTTTLFYLALVANICAGAFEGSENMDLVGLVYITWLLDSLFNVVCVLLVGFGPIHRSLGVVGAEVTAGKETTDKAESSSSEQPACVIGIPATPCARDELHVEAS